MWHFEARSWGQVHASAHAVISLLNSPYQFCLPITSAETAAQALHALPGHYAAIYLGFPIMHISRQLTGVLPPHSQIAKRTDIVRVLVAIACDMPLRGNLRCLDSQGVARTDHPPRTSRSPCGGHCQSAGVSPLSIHGHECIRQEHSAGHDTPTPP
jgi:hypothetical protein